MSAIIIKTHIGSFTPISPFDRAENKTIDDLKDGEREYEVCSEFVHTVTWDGKPPQFICLDENELIEFRKDPFDFRQNKKPIYREKCFLWVIEETSLKIVREKIRNEKRAHDADYICHTNLTGAQNAYVGGEILFDANETLYINNFSDRYGGRNTPSELWNGAIAIFKALGYTNIIDMKELYGTNIN